MREAALPGAWGRSRPLLQVVGSAAATMLLRSAWRRAASAVTAARGARPAVPTRELRLRGTLVAASLPLSREARVFAPGRHYALGYSGTSWSGPAALEPLPFAVRRAPQTWTA